VEVIYVQITSEKPWKFFIAKSSFFFLRCIKHSTINCLWRIRAWPRRQNISLLVSLSHLTSTNHERKYDLKWVFSEFKKNNNVISNIILYIYIQYYINIFTHVLKTVAFSYVSQVILCASAAFAENKRRRTCSLSDSIFNRTKCKVMLTSMACHKMQRQLTKTINVYKIILMHVYRYEIYPFLFASARTFAPNFCT